MDPLDDFYIFDLVRTVSFMNRMSTFMTPTVLQFTGERSSVPFNPHLGPFLWFRRPRNSPRERRNLVSEGVILRGLDCYYFLLNVLLNICQSFRIRTVTVFFFFVKST